MGDNRISSEVAAPPGRAPRPSMTKPVVMPLAGGFHSSGRYKFAPVRVGRNPCRV